MVRFEDEFPLEAAFLMQVFKEGGSFMYPKGYFGTNYELLKIRKVRRNSKCPCGSQIKTKHCHMEWTKDKYD